MKNVDKRDPGDWWKNGMHGWHAGSNAAIAARLGVLALPFQWLAGLFHELPLDWKSFRAEQHNQGTINHFLDSLTDIVANTYGMTMGILISPRSAGNFAALTGNYIPGPGDPDPAVKHGGGGTHTYRGNPVDAWGQYP